MDAKKQFVLDALKHTQATREARRTELEAAGLIPANDEKTEATVVPSTTEEHLRRTSKKKVIPRDAFANEFRHRKILGNDYE